MGRRRRKAKPVCLSESCSPSSSSTARALVMEVTTEAEGKGSLNHPTPWMDLHDYVYKKILEKLPLSDYIRFGAVCKKWQSIQTNHKLLYAPYPPPLLPIPWAIPSSNRATGKRTRDGVLRTILSPFEGHGRTYGLRNLLTLPNQTRPLIHVGIGPGWMLLLDHRVGSFYLHNPISRQAIKLPPLHLSVPCEARFVFVSPPPHFVIFIRTRNVLFLIREEDDDWTPLTHSSAFSSTHRTIFCGGNLYSLLQADWNLLSVCPRPTPTVDKLEMDMSPPLMHGDGKCYYLRIQSLVESEGEVLLVLGIGDVQHRLRFHVFKADLSKKTWVKMESLGDQSLLLTLERCVSVPASDIGNGFVKNSIMFYDTVAWKIFKLGFDEGMDFPDSPFFDASIFSSSMFVPTLC